MNHPIDVFFPDKVPFDTYDLVISVFVIEKATNKSVPIVTFAAGEGPEDFVVVSTEEDTKSNFTYDSGAGPATVEVESRVAAIGAQRSQLSKAFTLCLFFINWGLTVGSVYITVALLVVPRKKEMEAAVFLLPVTVVLTISTLRSLYVGSPPFGIFIGKSWALRC